MTTNTHLLSHSFCRSRVHVGLTLLRVSQDCNKGLAGPGSSGGSGGKSLLPVSFTWLAEFRSFSCACGTDSPESLLAVLWRRRGRGGHPQLPETTYFIGPLLSPPSKPAPKRQILVMLPVSLTSPSAVFLWLSALLLS